MGIFSKLKIFAFLLFTLSFILVQHYDSMGQLPIKEFREGDYIDSLKIYKKVYGKNKVIPKDYELPVLLTLSHYPELKDISIEFVQKKIKTTMATRPALSKIYKSKKKTTF